MTIHNTITIGKKRILVEKIIYFKAISNYTIVHTHEETFVISKTLKRVITSISINTFLKIRRGVIVNIDYINILEIDDVLIIYLKDINKQFKVSRRLSNEVINFLVKFKPNIIRYKKINWKMI